jgi:hypothetical protein
MTRFCGAPRPCWHIDVERGNQRRILSGMPRPLPPIWFSSRSILADRFVQINAGGLPEGRSIYRSSGVWVLYAATGNGQPTGAGVDNPVGDATTEPRCTLRGATHMACDLGARDPLPPLPHSPRGRHPIPRPARRNTRRNPAVRPSRRTRLHTPCAVRRPSVAGGDTRVRLGGLPQDQEAPSASTAYLSSQTVS